jgi:photosynthetic reaction center cytochrome c subunit
MKKLPVLISAFFIFTVAFYTIASCQTNKPKNLKVLRDKNMTRAEMKEYMRNFTLSLGVECEYCHNTDDYASDEKREKDAAREMIKLVYMLNDTYFKNAKEEISCYSCHRGQVQTKNIPPGL